MLTVNLDADAIGTVDGWDWERMAVVYVNVALEFDTAIPVAETGLL